MVNNFLDYSAPVTIEVNIYFKAAEMFQNYSEKVVNSVKAMVSVL